MEKKLINKLKKIITPLIILLVILLAIYVVSSNKKDTPDSVAECIGKKTELYTQLGCHACKIQEDLFGKNYDKLNVTDCFYETDKCIQQEIVYTPTWIIQGKKYTGVQSLEFLKDLTGC